MAFGAGIWNVPWLNENSQRNYPISEEATLRDAGDSFTLPLSLIVDFVWPIHATANIAPDKFHLRNLNLFGDGFTLSFGYDGDLIGSVSISYSVHVRNQSYFISGVGDFYDSMGKIAIGSVDDLVGVGGAYTFDIAGGRLEPTVIRPNLRGVTAVRTVEGNILSEPLVGDIELIPGRGIEFSLVPGMSKIIISATGSDLIDECICSNLTSDAPCIRTINGVPPDISGNIDLISADDCLEITTGEHMLIFKDLCSKSCCGCEELEPIVQDLNLLNVEVNTLKGLVNRLDAQSTTALLNLLASKTGELPCEEVI